ncbi:MAG: Verru_Chthon cassette protein A, partial [Roseimicrobium sp.]
MNAFRYSPLKSQRQGVALTLVLAVMALLLVLVLAILRFGETETRAAKIVTQISEARHLAELPPNLVMGQIREATSGLGQEKTWTSQPGMIRVFGTEPATPPTGRSKLVGAWKLYSSGQMVVGEGFDAVAEATSLNGWELQPATFTDLNAPVAVPQPGGALRRVHPIVEPSAAGVIDGFSIQAGLSGVTPERPVPMPVRWLYVLRDGRFALPMEENDGVAQFDGGSVHAENPVVGRIAFWTDDESCKVNINTASEGTPWDVPRSTSWTDRNYARYVPAQNEFQRFPGHPATTCLSTVLGAFDVRFQWKDPGLNDMGAVTSAAYVPFLESMYSITPRVNHGSTSNNTQGGSAAVSTSLAAALSGLPVKQERLYVSVDELFFNPERARNAAGAGAAPLSADEVNTARFFLTAHSRAPETNLLNRPRVSLWPAQSASATTQTAKDKLLGFCARVAGRQVAWQRASMWTSASAPGSSQSPTADFALPGNQTLFHYLQKLTAKPVPAFRTETFLGKYGQDNRNQILCEVFDMQRWGLNSWTALYDPGTAKLDAKQSYFYLPPRAYTGKNSTYIGEACAVPTRISSLPNNAPLPGPALALKAFGRFPTIVEVAVVFMATEVLAKDGKPHTATSEGTVPLDEVNNLTHAYGADGWADVTTKIRAYLILQPFTPAIGMPPYTANIRYKIKGLETWKVNGQPLFPAGIQNATNRAWRPAGPIENAHATAYTGLHAQFLKGN